MIHFPIKLAGMPPGENEASLSVHFQRKRSRYPCRRLLRDFLESDLYETSEPIGLAEGLTMDRENIWIILDNNGVSRKAPATGIASVLIKFKRPRDF